MLSTKVRTKASGLLLSDRTATSPSSSLCLVCGAVIALIALPARAQDDDGLLHYVPPHVDQIYPAPEPTEPGGEPSEEPKPETPVGRAPEPTEADEPEATKAPSIPAAPEAPARATPTPSTTDAALEAPHGQGWGEDGEAFAEPEDDLEFGASARVERKERGPVEIPLVAARDVPGAFGDPLRIIDALPGVVPIASAVPYVYIRGAPPAAQGYVYDGIPLPQLFHGAFGPAVIHPRATGPIKLYGGVAPAMYGRRSGAFVLAGGVEPGDSLEAEAEIRLIDINGWIQAPTLGGTVTASGRIGYPKLALLIAEKIGAIPPGANFNYMDGQVRYERPISRRNTFELVWLGSFDSVNLPGIEEEDQVRAGSTALAFHRLETRLVHELPNGHISTALRFGFDASALAEAVSVRTYTIGPRVWSRIDLGGGRSLRMGGDLYASLGNVQQNGGTVGSPEGNIQVRLPEIAEAAGRNQGGVFVETVWPTSERTRLEAGLRFDYWSVQSKIDVAVDPRARFTVEATDDLSFHVAAGTSHQPAVFLLPLPGLSDIAIADGLTRAIQTELGGGYDLPAAFRFELQGFFHHYDRMLLPELVQDAALPEDPPLSSAYSYGLEVFLRREATERFSGWLSYTLAWAEADSGAEVIGKFKPDFDVRHVVNAIATAVLPRGFTLGGRIQARSGRLINQLNPRYEQRLPWFFRADARVGYNWKGRFADMTAYIEWLNLTIAQEYLNAECFFGQCQADAAAPLALPNLGVRATF